MHMVIRVIVHAPGRDEALSLAKDILDGLCGPEARGDFDYYQTFDEPGTPASGRGRWGDLPAISEADSEVGRDLIETGIEATRNELFRDLATIRSGLAFFSDDDIWENNMKRPDLMSIDRLRYCMNCVGSYSGPAYWLYDTYGQAIRSGQELEAALEVSDGNLRAYVVPADVHF